MELSKILKELPAKLSKYRYAILILIIGMILMIIPERNDTSGDTKEIIQTANAQSQEESMAEILSNVDGAGAVRVMLSVKTGEETIYQTDVSQSSGNDSSNSQKKTVIISTSQRDQEGLVCQINPAVYQGAIVLCQGADDPAVRLAITEAVSKITGLGMDRVVVLKMK